MNTEITNQNTDFDSVFKKLKFNWEEKDPWGEFEWKQTRNYFIIDCFQVIRPSFTWWSYEIEQIIRTDDDDDRSFQVQTGNVASKYCRTLEKVKDRAMIDLYHWIKSGQAERITHEFLSAIYH
ncbi:hypothetical protein QD357_23210 [Rhizobium sp. BR 317]|uniref:hypothetical protein n=1 Tax=Rhizobium sp. BR 317 TaxID=3040015 RepID=UPI0039BF8DCB